MTILRILWNSLLASREFARPECSLWHDERMKDLKAWRFALVPVGFLMGILAGVSVAGRTSNGTDIKPPLNAEFLLYLLMTPQNCDALVGDLEERYRTIRKRFGARRANFWYWVQVFTSVGPIIWAATKRLLKAVSGVAAVVEMWRRMRS
jgi:hypothetical protein